MTRSMRHIGTALVATTLGLSSWNFYVEYATEFATGDWPGAAAKNKYRANVSYSMPVG